MERITRKRKLFCITVLLIVTLGITLPSWAEYPDKPITLLCAHPSGGGTDAMARLLAKYIGDILGQPVVVVNRSGGGGGVMAMALKQSKPDGYTLGISSSHTYTFMPNYAKAQYAIEDYVFVSALGSYQPCLICKADKPWKDFNDLITYSKANPGLKCVSQTPLDKLVLNYIAQKEGGIKWATLPVKGGAGMATAILGNHADFSFSFGTHYKYVKAGQMKVLAASSSKRLASFPEIPTLKEMGYDVIMDVYSVIAVPKGVSDHVIKKLADAISKAAKNQEYLSFLTGKLHFPALDWGPEKVTSAIKRDNVFYKSLIEKLKPKK